MLYSVFRLQKNRLNDLWSRVLLTVTKAISSITTAILLLATAMLPCTAKATDEAALQDEINFYNLSFTPSLQSLLKDMVEYALTLTKEDYGPYTLNYNTLPLDLERLCKDSQEGKIDIFFTAHRPKKAESCGAAMIETTLLNKALGLRLITIHKDNLERFSQIKTLDDLRPFAMGIGHSWEENKILAKYNLPLEIAILNASLLPMLEKKRFDYLATSSLDKLTYASQTYIYNNENIPEVTRRANTKKAEVLITLDDFFIYYPVPVEIHLSQRNPLLAERLKQGAKRFAKSEESKRMIAEALKDIPFSKTKKIRLLLLDNPLFDAEKNQFYKEQFLAEMPSNVIVLPHE